ncbi:hypothetical protein CC2G_007171 [Coprinopsis cinerea AmutBmut pab1-1]|nr:hypothetical protein CC2G_007171 [Coprinopsis cinerea AmutBmut pab1-1]
MTMPRSFSPSGIESLDGGILTGAYIGGATCEARSRLTSKGEKYLHRGLFPLAIACTTLLFVRVGLEGKNAHAMLIQGPRYCPLGTVKNVRDVCSSSRRYSNFAIAGDEGVIEVRRIVCG